MKILFIDNLLLPEKGDFYDLDVHPHLGLLSLVAVTRQAGHDAIILDPKVFLLNGKLKYDQQLYRLFADIILDHNPDVVGFTTLGCSFIFAISVAQCLKERNDKIPILFGGPHATILHRKILERFHMIDVVVRNEAEETINPILSCLATKSFAGIPGVSWREENNIFETQGSPTIEDVDSLIFPAYDSYPIQELNLEYIRVDAGRGCPFKCTFCSTASFFGRTYRLKSPAKLLSELDELSRRYGITDFKLNHDLFTVNRKKVIAFCNAIRGKGYTWGVSARIDCVDEELLCLMREAGCTGIYFGLETGSARMQKISQKKLDLSLVEPILDVTERLGMRTIVSFITGYPEETEMDQNQSLDLLGLSFKRNRILFTTQLHMLTPEPGTALDLKYGNDLRYDGYLTDFNALSLRPSDTELIKNNPDIFMTYHYYPTELLRERHIFVVEAYRNLRKCGHTILSYLLRFYNSQFSLLIRSFEKWFESQGRDKTKVSVDSIIEFFTITFGIEHHVTSLVRYSLLTKPARKRSRESSSERARFSKLRKYTISPNAHLFKDLHSCSELIQLIQDNIRENIIYDNIKAGLPGFHLVIATGKGVDGILDNYEINEEAFYFLQLFKRPVSYNDLLKNLPSALAEHLPSSTQVKRLVQIKALVAQ